MQENTLTPKDSTVKFQDTQDKEMIDQPPRVHTASGEGGRPKKPRFGVGGAEVGTKGLTQWAAEDAYRGRKWSGQDRRRWTRGPVVEQVSGDE